MPKFTLTKHSDNNFDSEVTMEFFTETVDLAKAHFEDFLKASGFEIPIENSSEGFFIPDPEDWHWDDAFEAKFGITANDGLVGNAGADILQFRSKEKS